MGNGEIVCVCGDVFMMRESYQQHLKVCTGPKNQGGPAPPPGGDMITFEKPVWDQFMARLRDLLGRLIAEERCCPECQHKFVPSDDLSKEATEAWMGIFGGQGKPE